MLNKDKLSPNLIATLFCGSVIFLTAILTNYSGSLQMNVGPLKIYLSGGLSDTDYSLPSERPIFPALPKSDPK